MKKYFYIIISSLFRKLPGLRDRSLTVIAGPNKGYKWSLRAKDNSCLLGTYETETFSSVAKHIKPGNIIYDIGANTGYFSLAFSRLAGNTGHIYAFEPLPSNIDILHEHVKINKVKNISVKEICVSDHEGSIEFSENENTVANTYISSSPVFTESKKIKVNCSSLDKLIMNSEIRSAQIIKIDVEGAEYDVLKGAAELIRSQRPVLFIATHNNHNKGVREKCIAFLENNYLITSVNKSSDGEMEDLIAIPKNKN